MEIPCVSFTSNKRKYVVIERSIINSYPYRRIADAEVLVMSDGTQFIAEHIRYFNFIDISKHENSGAIQLNQSNINLT